MGRTKGEKTIETEPARTKRVSKPKSADAADTQPTTAAEQPAVPGRATKQAALVAMLQQPEGASLAEIVAATGWQAHTVRGAISGALKKKLRLDVTSQNVEGRGRVYRIQA